MFKKNILDYSHLDSSIIKTVYNKKIDYSLLVKRELSNYFFQTHSKSNLFFVTSSARSSLNLVIQSLNFNINSEIIVLGHTCSEVPNVIISNNLNPVYVDIKIDSLSFSLNDFKKKISSKTSAVIIQHHLGFFNFDPKLISFLKERSIIVIEDCALSLGSKYKKTISGTIGDISIFSFGKSKTFNAYIGGAILVNNENFIKNITHLYDRIPRLGNFRTFMLKLFFRIEKSTYNSKYYKTLIFPLGLLKIIAIVFNIDYHLSNTNFKLNIQRYDYLLPNYFSFIVYLNVVDLKYKVSEKLLNLKSCIKIIKDHNLEKYLHKLYFNKNFSICSNRLLFINQSKFKLILNKLKLKNITSNKNFYNKPIDGKNYKLSNYSIGDCPNSEWLCQNMLQLPF